MSKLFMMVGIVASGKSTIAERLRKNGAKVHSSDAIREELLGDINAQSDNELVFRMLHNRIKTDLSKGYDVVYDATNISRKKRMAFLREIEKMNVKKVAIVMATPYEQALINNSKRDRKVPEHVIEKMYKAFFVPQYFEGWDKIVILYYKGVDENIRKMYDLNHDFMDMVNNFDQENKNHTLTLGKHMDETARILIELDSEVSTPVLIASMYHDYGKLYTKSFFNSKREAVESATYYSHDNVSAYIMMFFAEYPMPYRHHVKNAFLLDIIFYIQYHMMPFHFQGESDKAKFRKMVGEFRLKELELLHQADKLAH